MIPNDAIFFSLLNPDFFPKPVQIQKTKQVKKSRIIEYLLYTSVSLNAFLTYYILTHKIK